MKNKTSMIFFCMIPSLLSLGFADITKTYTFTDPILNERGEIELEGCYLPFSSGAPAIPVKSVTLLLPVGQKAISFDVTYQEAEPIHETFSIEPLPLQLPLSQRPTKQQLNYRSTAYAQNAFYPQEVRSAGFATSIVHNYRLFVTTIHPVQYNPITGQLRTYRTITVTVKTELDGTLHYRPIDAEQKHYISSIIDNPEDVSSIELVTSKQEDDYDYLLITPEKFKSGFADFIEFNKRRALKTKLETIETIVKMNGSDTQEKMRNFIKQQYDNCHIKFVLIGGDHDGIPTRGMACKTFDYDTVSDKIPDPTKNGDFYDFKNIASDLYFACLDGTWQVPGSKYFGEYGAMDIGHEVFVGRICIDTETDQKNILNKIMLFSEKPDTANLLKSLLLGEYLWGGSGDAKFPTAVYGDYTMSELNGDCAKNGYTTKGFSKDFEISKLFETETKGWAKSSAALLARLKEFKPVWLNHDGHASPTACMSISNKDITSSNFLNNGTNANFFIAFSQGCYPGSFDNVQIPTSPANVDTKPATSQTDCLAEKMTNAESGAIACLFNSRYGFGAAQGTNGSAQKIHRSFYDALFNKKIHSLGQMLAYAKDCNKDGILDSVIGANKIGNGWPSFFGQLKFEAYELNLIGDPALNAWSCKPRKMDQKLPDVLTSGKVELQTQPFCRIAFISKSNDIITTSVADDKGKVKIDDTMLANYIASNPKTEIKVHLCAPNFYPFQGSIMIDATGIDNTAQKMLVQCTAKVLKSSAGIQFTLNIPQPTIVTISLYTLSGKRIAHINHRVSQSGTYATVIPHTGIANGYYFAELKTCFGTNRVKIALMK